MFSNYIRVLRILSGNNRTVWYKVHMKVTDVIFITGPIIHKNRFKILLAHFSDFIVLNIDKLLFQYSSSCFVEVRLKVIIETFPGTLPYSSTVVLQR